MALNNHTPYDSEDDLWEMVGDEAIPLVESPNDATAAPDDAGVETESRVERESHQLEADAPDGMDKTGMDGSDSFVSGVSSITGDHCTVSDVEEGEDGVNLDGDNKEGVDTPDEEQEAPTTTSSGWLKKPLDCDKELQAKVADMAVCEEAYYDAELKRWIFPGDDPTEAAKPPAPPSMIPEKAESPDTPPEVSAPTADFMDKTEEEKSESSDLVGSLSNMGFEKERIENAIGDLREAGAMEIDEDSVIGEMAGEMNDNRRTWDFVESTARDFDAQHQLRRRTQNCVRTIGLSAKELWSNVKDESQRFRSNLQQTCDQADIQAQTARATTQVKYAASSAGDSICRANEEYRITEKVVTAAVVGGATLLALGNPRAAVGVIAVAGATLAAGEAMKHSSEQSTSTYTRDYGLGQGVHLD